MTVVLKGDSGTPHLTFLNCLDPAVVDMPQQWLAAIAEEIDLAIKEKKLEFAITAELIGVYIHDVDTTEKSFREVTIAAMRQALQNDECVKGLSPRV